MRRLYIHGVNMLAALQRLLESTFRLDIAAAREYCEADDRWIRATAFLAANGGAGWSLIEVRRPLCAHGAASAYKGWRTDF